MATQITVPDFNYLARLFPEVRQALRQRGRVNVPELTVEDDRDPFMQLEIGQAAVAHHITCLGDWIARHFSLPTSVYRPGVAALLAVIDERLAAATPASADLVARLTRTLTSTEPALVPARSRFATVPAPGAPAVVFESPATPISASRTDQLLSYRYDAAGGTYAAPPTGATNLWPTPGAGDALYLGHADLMFDAAQVALGQAAIGLVGVWEYSGRSEANPSSVTWGGGNLTFGLTSLLGSASRAGAVVTILCVVTGQSATFTSVFGGGINRIVTNNVLGQIGTPSTSAADYLISVEWTELPGVGGGNDGLDSTSASDVAWTLPQTLTHDWRPATVNGVQGYWVRFRVITAASTQPRLSAAAGPGAARFFVLIPLAQGETVEDTLGISDGSAGQAFPLHREGFIEGTLTALTVGTDADWIVSDESTDLYSAEPTEKVALLEQLPDGTLQVLCGDGTHGAVPPAGEALAVSYRIGADEDGNVGAEAISRNISGLALLTDLANPRPAAGWAAAEGSTAASLERVKRTKPAAYRTQGRALNADDAEALVVDGFLSADGKRPVARAWGVEEAFGLKTIGLVCVGAGGAALTSGILEEIGVWFNGADPNDPARRLLANTTLTASNFSLRTIAGSITVKVRKSATGVQEQVLQIISDLLQPLATFEDDGTYRWEPGRYGGKVAPNMVEAAVIDLLTVRRAVEVEVTDINGGGAVAVALGTDELPSCGAWTVTVVVL